MFVGGGGGGGGGGTSGVSGWSGTSGTSGVSGWSGTSGTAGPSTLINATAQTSGTYYVVGIAATGSNQTASAVTASPINFNAANGTMNAVVFNVTSDITQKTDVTSIENAFDTVDKLQGVEFNWKLYGGNKSAGVIAQQLESILPHLVSTDEKGLKSVNYSGLTGYLIEAIKELGAEIKTLRNR